jgi:transposase
MEREALAAQLAQGRSIEAIARDCGRAASTVAYWVNKHGLTSAHAARHAPRGGIERERLAALVEEGLSIRAMAERLEVSYTTVRHWLKTYAIRTPRARRLAETAPARASGAETTMANCPDHGWTTFVRRGSDGFRCQLCRTGAVQRRRREVKRQLVEEAGGACVLCGYDRTLSGLHFHHLNPADKAFGLSREGVTRALDTARAEASKCVLLCSNCHVEVEAGAVQLPRPYYYGDAATSGADRG